MFKPLGCIAHKHFQIVWFSNLSILNVPDEGNFERTLMKVIFRNALNLYIYVFLFGHYIVTKVHLSQVSPPHR
jgi:hypothetical protein